VVAVWGLGHQAPIHHSPPNPPNPLPPPTPPPKIAIAQSKAHTDKPFGLPVVVLADRNKSEMDREIADALGGKLRVITRSGSTTRLEDLRRTGAADAATVLLQWPEGKPRVRLTWPCWGGGVVLFFGGGGGV